MTVPTLVGFEHASTTVPDLDEAVAFFVDHLGFELVARARFGPERGPEVMAERFGAHPEATCELAALRTDGLHLELWCYDAPDLRADRPRNCDAGGHHLGFRVDDIDAAARYLDEVPGVRVLHPVTHEPPEGGVARSWVYFLSPWGLHLELASEHPVGA